MSEPIPSSFRFTLNHQQSKQVQLKKVKCLGLISRHVYKIDLWQVTEDAGEQSELLSVQRSRPEDVSAISRTTPGTATTALGNAILLKPQTHRKCSWRKKQLREQLIRCDGSPWEKQAKRIYARYYLV